MNKLGLIRERLDRLLLEQGQMVELASTDGERAYENTINDLIKDAQYLLSLIVTPSLDTESLARQIVDEFYRQGFDDYNVAPLIAQRITAYASSRDTEVREVLEGLAVLVPDGFCWCAVASDLHEPECLAARALYVKLGPGGEPTCSWTYDSDGYWQTSCDDQFCITEGSPAENRMRYCHYCGRRITTSAEVGVIDALNQPPEKSLPGE